MSWAGSHRDEVVRVGWKKDTARIRQVIAEYGSGIGGGFANSHRWY